MEFFLPSLLILVLAAFVVFFILPKFAPLILAIIALLALVLGAYNHYMIFKLDYRMMSWQDGASAAAPYILVGFIVLYITGFLINLYKSKSPTVQSSIAYNVPGASMTDPMYKNQGVNFGRNMRNRNEPPRNMNRQPQSLIF